MERPDGVRIPYAVWGEGPHRMVFGHSLTATGLDAEPFVEPLVDAGFAVVGMDLRGHGRCSPVTEPALLTPQAMGGDLLAIMDDLGWDSAWLGGGSMGAAPALCAATAVPERVEGLLLLAPAFGDQPNPSREPFARIARVLDEEGLEAGRSAWREVFLARGLDAGVVEEQAARLGVHDLPSIAAALRTVPGWRLPDEMAAVPGLPMPVAVVAWTDDDIHPLSLARRIATAAPKGALAVLGERDTGGGSNPLFDLAAELVADALAGARA